MIKEIINTIRQSFIYGLENLSHQIVALFLLPVYTRFLTPEDYGVMAIAGIFMTIIKYISELGLRSAWTRFYKLKKTHSWTLKQVEDTAIIVMIITTVIFGVLFIFSASFLSQFWFKSTKYTFVFKLSGLTLILQLLFHIPQQRRKVAERAASNVAHSLIALFIGISINIYLIVFLKWGLKGIYYGPVFTMIIVVLINLQSWIKAKWDFDKSLLFSMLKYSIPILFGNLSIWIVNLSDRWVLNLFVSLEEIGIYQVGYRMGMGIGFVVIAFKTALPQVSYRVAQDNSERDAKSFFSKIFFLYPVICGLPVIALSIFSKDLMMILTTEKFHSAFQIVPIVALAYFFEGATTSVGMGIDIKGKTKYIPIFLALGGITNIILNFIFVPIYGIVAAAWTSVIAFIIPFVGYAWVTNKFYYIQRDYGHFCQILGIIFLVVLIYSKTIPFLYIQLNSIVAKIGFLFFAGIAISFGALRKSKSILK